VENRYLAFSQIRVKNGRSHMQVAHIKDSMAVGNLKRVDQLAAALAKFKK